MTMALDEEKIQKQAKLIMDEFINALDKVGDLTGDVGLERDDMTRTARKTKPDETFRERMLRNAPKKDDGHIVAEKRSW